MKELAKTYDPKAIEQTIYDNWIAKKYFHAEPDENKKPFTIIMPPPNITGQLHMGHALNNTLQDVVIRQKRMQGYNALWQPGCDHASIATEVKIIEELKKEGLHKEDLGREAFLKRAWEWKEEYGGRIVNQLKKLGSSADWDRERFTMDEGVSNAVLEVFVKLYEKGWIYKGTKIINWCPKCQTSVSDAEVEHKDTAGHFWHINYPIKGEDDFIEIATTRPETMLGDTAVVVHPDDPRYQKYIGKTCILPLMDREIPIIADEYIDLEVGTGAMKVTPAHDPNDFELGRKHGLEEICVFNDDGSINENGGKYAGMGTYEARDAVVKDLEELGLLVKVLDHEHAVGYHDRCSTVIEPMVKEQWFVKMDEMIKPAIKAVDEGEVKLIPGRMSKLYHNWTDNIRDWCISRQLWWGHRIPAYYCDDCGEMVVAKEMPSVCPKCGKNHFHQDEDCLDTWFSSALWPFSTLGWPEKTKDLEYFYPTDLLITGYDIIFFWVIRMIFSGYEQMGERPFDAVLFTGLVRDDKGRKMSKSLGNGIDPLEVIDQYGADALRFTLATGNSPGNDMRFYYERVQASRNFANKIWNASRFIMMNMPEDGLKEACPAEKLQDADKWILSKANRLAKEVTENLDKYEIGIAADKLYEFIWEEFCDWYIEMVKPRLYGENESKDAALYTLQKVLMISLKLLHPYMPFVTEEIYTTLRPYVLFEAPEESIMISAWPEYSDELNFAECEEATEMIKEAVRGIRTVRSDMNVPLGRKVPVHVVSEKEHVRDIFENGKIFFASLGKAAEVYVQKDMSGIGDDAVSVQLADVAVYIPLEELVDKEKELARLEQEKKRLEGELKRSDGMLNNPNFVSKAPEAKINQEKEKREKYAAQLEKVLAQIEKMKG
ncbi:MAG: valine--tRNA ligase [Lachnospiraceae bacterium]|nr:valine--tRNA ligase [Lachnospiraceae bacterium]